MNKTDIDWCDRTWNPVTGCQHGCAYCFAADFWTRFGGAVIHKLNEDETDIERVPFEVTPEQMLVIDEPMTRITKAGKEVTAPYPAGGNPTFHRYRLDEPKRVKKPQKIFTVDCGDLFGSWVPSAWIQQVFAACAAAPWHRYIFLTKNHFRYSDMQINLKGERLWDSAEAQAVMPISVFGLSATDNNSARQALDGLGYVPKAAAALLCLEPLHGPVVLDAAHLSKIQWVIVGAETGRRRGKVVPERSWVESIVAQCRKAEVPVFLKGNLAALWDGELIQEYPEVLRGIGA